MLSCIKTKMNQLGQKNTDKMVSGGINMLMLNSLEITTNFN